MKFDLLTPTHFGIVNNDTSSLLNILHSWLNLNYIFLQMAPLVNDEAK